LVQKERGKGEEIPRGNAKMNGKPIGPSPCRSQTGNSTLKRVIIPEVSNYEKKKTEFFLGLVLEAKRLP